jgi:hypothetical protein
MMQPTVVMRSCQHIATTDTASLIPQSIRMRIPGTQFVTAKFSPGVSQRFPFSAPLPTSRGVFFPARDRDWHFGEFGNMHNKTSGSTALILAVGLLAGSAAPLRAADTTASDNVSVSTPANPSGPQATSTDQAAGTNQLSELDRALHPEEGKTPPVVTQAAETPSPRANVVVAGSQNATWDETSLIGKIFIAFGALLTIASAARMFMA